MYFLQIVMGEKGGLDRCTVNIRFIIVDWCVWLPANEEGQCELNEVANIGQDKDDLMGWHPTNLHIVWILLDGLKSGAEGVLTHYPKQA